MKKLYKIQYDKGSLLFIFFLFIFSSFQIQLILYSTHSHIVKIQCDAPSTLLLFSVSLSPNRFVRVI